jgi:prepilin-type N-terminal cleavage/methylation domain-containing protein
MNLEARRTGRGFTMVELLIVIAIITILIVLSLSVAHKVTGSGKLRATEQTIRVLDQSLSAYINAEGGNPPATVIDPRPGNTGTNRRIQPVADARSEQSGEMINSVGLYMAQCKGIPAAEAAFKNIDAKFLREYNPEANAAPGNYQHQPTLPTVFDAWGNPIRYVHPAFKGEIYGNRTAGGGTPSDFTAVSDILGTAATNRPYGITSIRRNNVPTSTAPDSDGGANPSSRPYFYSCGPDGKVGYEVDASGKVTDFNADNVYMTIPGFQRK